MAHLAQGRLEDLPNSFLKAVRKNKLVAWDIETSGLDWRTDEMATCQFFTPGQSPLIIQLTPNVPQQMRHLLADAKVKKVFHHALFDLRFMTSRWQVSPKNIACTKIASKLLDKEDVESHSLKALLDKYLGIVIDKTEQTSNWFGPALSERQMQYAVSDVVYLPQLLQVLESQLREKGEIDLARACFQHIPVRTELDIIGYKDVFSY
jgi:ribonuclease D